jgi:putative PIN family toxin of toxin-antitoxin system
MIRAVFDTDMFVSSMIKRGKPRDLWNAVLDGRMRLIVSRKILEELVDVASRPKIGKYVDKAAMDSFLMILLQKAELVKTSEELPGIVKDSDDSVIFETAVAGGAGYIVSGDSHLIRLSSFREIKI